MATFSDNTANAMLEVLAAAGLFVALHSNNPMDDGQAELSNSGYARKAISFAAPVDQAIANAGLITFGPATEDWTAATYLGLWDAVSGGNFIAGAELNDPITVLDTDSATFSIGAIVFSLVAIP